MLTVSAGFVRPFVPTAHPRGFAPAVVRSRFRFRLFGSRLFLISGARSIVFGARAGGFARALRGFAKRVFLFAR